ncbi:MAG: M23 family metallopeptidase [Acidobacteria bacterium]|nr:M23 family metallopeptidase [Acidobacteriota bacterium]
MWKTYITGMVWLITLGMVVAGQTASSGSSEIDYQKMGDSLLRAILRGALDDYRPILTESATGTLTRETVAKIGAELTARYGQLLHLGAGEHQKTDQFHRVLFQCTFAKGATTMIIVLENETKVAGIIFPDVPLPKPNRQPPATPRPAVADRSQPAIKSHLRLPFTGKWKVVNSGKDSGRNRHASSRAERFGYDFILVGIDDRSFRTTGKKSEDYYAYEKEALAPAAGVIVQVINGIEDNLIGQTNLYNPLGNLVVIDHQNGEFSVLAHLAKGSLRVKERQKVKAGDPLALCGNSGDSPEPHLHYHLQDHARLSQANGLQIIFENYYSGNKPVEKGIPELNELVAN